MRIYYYNPYYFHFPSLSSGYYYYTPSYYEMPTKSPTYYSPPYTKPYSLTPLPSDYSDILSVFIANNLGNIPRKCMYRGPCKYKISAPENHYK